MKKIIDGVKYNTETAKEIATWDNSIRYGEKEYEFEALYIKSTGEYFLFAKGAAESRYSENIIDANVPNSLIIPFSKERAKEWCLESLSKEEYEAIWGVIPKANETSQDKIDRLLREKERLSAKLNEIDESLNQKILELKELREEKVAELVNAFLNNLEKTNDYNYEPEQRKVWIDNAISTLSKNELLMSDKEFESTYNEWLEDYKNEEIARIAEEIERMKCLERPFLER